MRLSVVMASILGIAVASLTAPAHADAKLTATVVVEGACQHLTVGGEDHTTDCKGTLLNTEYSDERTGFYFVTTAEQVTVTFSTRGDQEQKIDADTVTAPVDMVIVSSGGKIDRLQAKGACQFGNPYKGPMLIECTADSERGRFEGAFLTDGKEPDAKTF
ncbi:MAG TPA: hypothetical protein VFR21_23440 [Bradyrhizobium sp.]|jgi:hypothetical protein|nr:hypothetical protein [Bradyrhizobium sp.]